MIVKKIKIVSLSLLLLLALLVQNAGAELLNEYLPESSHYQGRTHFQSPTGGLGGRIEFAVYDTETDEFADFYRDGDES